MSQDPTEITLRTVLDAINEVSVELHNFRAEVNERFERLETEMNERFDDLDERMEVLAGDVVKARARAKRRTIRTGIHKPEKERA